MTLRSVSYSKCLWAHFKEAGARD